MCPLRSGQIECMLVTSFFFSPFLPAFYGIQAFERETYMVLYMLELHCLGHLDGSGSNCSFWSICLTTIMSPGVPTSVSRRHLAPLSATTRQVSRRQAVIFLLQTWRTNHFLFRYSIFTPFSWLTLSPLPSRLDVPLISMTRPASLLIKTFLSTLQVCYNLVWHSYYVATVAMNFRASKCKNWMFINFSL